MTYKELYASRADWYKNNHEYKLIYWDDFDFSALRRICYRRKYGREELTVNDCYIMADTETSKKSGSDHNHVVAWTISIRAYHLNIVTLWGRKPSDMIKVFDYIRLNMSGDQTVIYFHNLSYDYVFLRKFLFARFGYPDKELNTKPHYPICLTWDIGLVFKDSLILAQRSLEKWADDYNVQHKKAVGKWEYGKMRGQNEEFSAEELEYIEHDTLAGVECLDAMFTAIEKNIVTAPYTATGIPRNAVKKLAKQNHGKDLFNRVSMTYDQYRMATHVYHGGYTHANRHIINFKQTATCYDFASSYPYVLLAYKYPMEKFTYLDNRKPEDILKYMDQYAFMFKLILIKPRLKNDDIIMPVLQHSKTIKCINGITDNGRILCADYIEIYITEMDLQVIMQQYDHDGSICTEVYAACKDYLPRWLTDYIYQLFTDKTMLKGGDPVLYALAKAKLNSIYGMMVQKCIRPDLQEDFETGEYMEMPADPEEQYEKYLKNRNNILPYQWGVWVTAYALYDLYQLGACVAYDQGGEWLYSDTDSCYATIWNKHKLEDYNNKCKELLTANNYGPVTRNGREYWLGVAEFDGRYSEFITQGAKRYAIRDWKTGKLKITVAGVPKVGYKCLKNDINNFTKGMIFDGRTTGKLLMRSILMKTEMRPATA